MKAAEALATYVGVKPACDALRVARATFYRRRRPSTGHQQPRPTPARALSEKERDKVFDTLCSERFVDRSPAEVVATLLDEDVYLCSERTMYRVLASQVPVRERRAQRSHPEYQKPELMATGPGQVYQPNDVIVAPDGSIFVADGHSGQGMTTNQAIEEGRESGLTGRILKYAPDGTFIMEWGQIGTLHGEFRTPHALEFDSQGRLWVADRGNHRLEIFDQDGNYLESRYMYGRVSGLFITDDDVLYAIDSESGVLRHENWSTGVRIGQVGRDHIEAFIPPWPSDARPYQGVAGEGVAVDADGNVYAAEGPGSLSAAGAAFTKYAVDEM